MAGGDAGRWARHRRADGAGRRGHERAGVALRLSALVSFISETVLLGFKAGAAVTIAVTQLPKLFGVPGGGEHFFERLAILAGQLPDTNLVVLASGSPRSALLLAGERLLAGTAGGARRHGAHHRRAVDHLAGRARLPGGRRPAAAACPSCTLPALRLRDVDGVIPLAFACLLLAYVEGVSAARTLAAETRRRRSIRDRNCSGSAPPTWPRRSPRAIPWRAACRSRRSTTRPARRARSRWSLPRWPPRLCLLYLDGPAAQPPQRRARRDRAGRRQGPDRRPRAAAPVARQPVRVRGLDGRRLSACCCSASSRACCWRRSRRCCC